MSRMLATLLAAVAVSVTAVPSAVSATPLPDRSSIYAYAGGMRLSEIAPGTVLKTRSVQLHLQGIALPVEATQLLYRTTDAIGDPSVAVASVIKPLVHVFTRPRVVSYQAAYDSLSDSCEPSYAIDGGVNPLDALDTAELGLLTTFLLRGYTVVTADYEGENLAFSAGPGSGRATLDGVRAAFASRAVGLPAAAKVGLIGYSGGAIATEWATELAARYAPDVDRRLVGSAEGGVFVDPAHNLKYVNGTPVWSGAIPAAFVGVLRGYHVNPAPYLSSYGRKVFAYADDHCLDTMLAHWPGLTFEKLFKPAYANVLDVPVFVRILNQLIMGTGGAPTVPMLIAQGTGGTIEGTPGNTPGIGPGDGVMIAGDVRSLARTYCRRGVTVDYTQYEGVDHISGGVIFVAQAEPWLAQRFTDTPAPDNCASIQPGNSLAPLPVLRRS